MWAKYRDHAGRKVPIEKLCLGCRDFIWTMAPAIGSTADEVNKAMNDNEAIKSDVMEGLVVQGGKAKTFHQ